MKTNFKVIAVHNGQFHADDIFCCAIAKVFINPDIEIIRTNDVSGIISDYPIDERIIADVGGEYDQYKNMFDHHQDSDLSSACVMMCYQFIEDVTIRQSLMEHLFRIISDMDCGIKQVEPGSINAIIRSFNTIHEGFERALLIAIDILNAYYFNAKKAIDDQKRWINLEKIDKWILFQSDSDHILNWKEYAKNDSICFLICKSNRGNGYNLISRSTDLFVIPKSPTQTFRHNSGFMATYDYINDAINDAHECLMQSGYFTN